MTAAAHPIGRQQGDVTMRRFDGLPAHHPAHLTDEGTGPVVDGSVGPPGDEGSEEGGVQGGHPLHQVVPVVMW